MKKLQDILPLLALCLCSFVSFPANAQSLQPVVVSSCGTPPITYNVGQSLQMTIDTTGRLCDSGASAGGSPGTPSYTKQGTLTPLGYCQLSVTSTAVQTSTCSGGIPTGTTFALVCNEGSAARYRDDGTAPTASIGQTFAAGASTAPTCGNFFDGFTALQWIAQSGTAILDFTFYK